MELLENWIGPRISESLADALKWKSGDISVAADDARFLDDGNSIHIKPIKRKQFAQIIKIEDFSEPVQLWLSDARTKLKVAITTEATFFSETDFQYNGPRRVTDDTLGSIVQLLDYETVILRHGPKLNKIFMSIKRLKFIGSERSGVFGAPCHVESLHQVINMLDWLQTIQAQESSVRQSSTSFGPPKDTMSKDDALSPSQGTIISSVDDNLDKSQALFATQVPGLPSRKRRREELPKTDENPPDFVGRVCTTRSTALTTGGTQETPVLGPDSMDLHGAKVIPLQADKHRSSKPQQHQFGQETFHKSVESLPATAAEKSTATERHYALLSLLGPPKGANQNLVQPQTTMANTLDLHQEAKGSKRVSTPTNMTSASADLPCQRQITPGFTETHKPDMRNFRSSKKGNRVSKSPRLFIAPKIITRIRGREVRISKSQKDILDRSDSWCPPEPGNRTPTANVPISILQELNNRAERKERFRGSSLVSRTSRSLQRDQSSQTASELGGDDSASSKSDDLISSADWPPSPPERTNIPPDSSAKSSEDLGQARDQGTNPTPNPNHVTLVADDLSPSKRTSLSGSPFQSSLSSLNSNQTSLKTRSENTRNLQAPTTRPKMSLLEFSKLRKQEMSNKLPREENSYATIDKASANKTHLNTFKKSTTEPDLYSHETVNQSSHFLPSSKMMRGSLLVHDEIDERSSKHLSPTAARNAEIYHESDSSTKVEKSSPDLDSDLETSIPHGLDRTIDIPSTFRVDQEPSIQIDRTPYVPSLLKPLSASSTEAKNAVSKHQNHGSSNLSDLTAAPTFRARHNASSEQDDSSEVVIPISTIEETKLPLYTSSRMSKSPRNMQATKRKASEFVVLSPNVTKRKRAFRVGPEYDSCTNIGELREVGRQHRNELFAQFIKSEHTDGVDHSPPRSLDVINETVLEVSYQKPSQPSAVDPLDKADVVKQEENPKDHDGMPMPPQPILRLRKCLIRPLCEGDAESLASQANNQDIAKWMRNAFPYPYRIEDATKWISIATASSPLHDFAICRPDDNTVIGGIGLKAKHDVSHRTMQIGYWLGEGHWRKGIVTEAVSAFSEWTFEQFRHLVRLEAEVYEGNDPSIRVLENAGYAFEAKNRNAIEKMGVVRSVLIYCKFPDSEEPHERKTAPNLAPVAEQSVADVSSAPEKKNATKDRKNIGGELPKSGLHFDEDTRRADHTVSSNLYDRFKDAYPEYLGNESQFTAICKRIVLLVRKNSMEHPSLWDDFAVRHRTKYPQYLIQCSDEAIDPLSYEIFYREKVSRTKYSCPSGLVLTRNSISDFLPEEPLLQRASKSGSPIEDLFIPQSTEIDDRVSAGSPAATGREVAHNANSFNTVSPDSGAIDNDHVSRPKRAGRHNVQTRPIGPSLQRQQSRPLSHTKSFTPSSNGTRSTFSLGAEKLLQDLERAKGETKKEVIELLLDSEDQQSVTSPRKPLTSTARPKRGRRSLPWTGPDSQSNAKASGTAKTAASTSTPSAPKHKAQVPASTSKVGIPKESSSPFAAFGPAKSDQEDVIEIFTPTTHKPSDERSTKKLTKKPSENDNEEWKKVKKFIRNYQAISPGKGNSWAQELSQDNKASMSQSKARKKLVDPLDWEL